MQDRYTGDIGDFGKLGLLRRLEGFSLGINWYLTPDEIHNGDGRHTNYLHNDAFRDCDASLWTALRELVFSGQRQVASLERAGILSAEYYAEPLDFTGSAKQERERIRQEWHASAVRHLSGCGLIFVDPDNGLIVPSAAGTARSNKFVLPAELADYYRGGASVIYYQHKARRPDAFYIEQHRQLVRSGLFPDAAGLGLKFVTTSQRYYFFLLQPQHRKAITSCVEKMLRTPWAQHFQLLDCTLC